MKRIKLLVLSIIITTAFCSCTKKQEEKDINNQNESSSQLPPSENKHSYNDVQDMLVNMNSYAALADVTYISNKNQNTYKTLQVSNTTGEYRVEVLEPENVSGNITTYDGKTIYQRNSKISENISLATTDTQERSEIFVTSFLENYAKSNEVSVAVGEFGEGKCTILEAIIPGKHPYLSTEKLWIDNETLVPVKLAIYDADGTERIVIEYTDFVYNPAIDPNIFVLQ